MNTIPNYPAIIGRQVKKIRNRIGMTQVDLANHCDLMRTYISRIELGQANPRVNVLADLAKAMNVNISDLLADDLTV